MVGHFDEAFYRNKRAALLSSIVLVLVTVLSIQIESNASIYVFRLPEINNATIVILAFVVCLYQNASYFLHYRTEIPEWRKNPETGLQQIEDLKNSLDQLKIQVEAEEQNISRTRLDANDALRSLESKFAEMAQTDFAGQLEAQTAKRLEERYGPIHSAVFNQISAAIHKGPKTQHVLSNNLNWEDLAKKVVAEVSARIVGLFQEKHVVMLNAVQQYLEKAIKDVEERTARVEEQDCQRVSQLAELTNRLRKTERQLRSWQSAMNLRLRVQYFWLPMIVFAGGALYAIASLINRNIVHLAPLERFL